MVVRVYNISMWSWAPVAHSCNPSYSGDRHQEDCGLKPAQANRSKDPISINPSQKIGLVEWLKVKALNSSPSTTKKKKKKYQHMGSMAGKSRV
jgi:hypothetical protein